MSVKNFENHLIIKSTPGSTTTPWFMELDVNKTQKMKVLTQKKD